MLFISIFFIQFIITVYGGISPKFTASCVPLMNDTRIYCYSGGNSVVGISNIMYAETDHNYLDLTQNELVLGSIASKWTKVPDDPNFILEASIGGTPVKLSDTSYLIDGGYHQGGYRINQTVQFDSVTNTWSSISNAGRNQSNQVFGESGVYVKAKDYVAFWGGLTGRFPGVLLNDTAVLRLYQGSWSNCLDPSNGANSRFGHTATYDEQQKRILYIGGSTLSHRMVPIKSITIFDTTSLEWSIKIATSIANINDRYRHTATRLPSTGMILIYGGAADDGNFNVYDNNTLSKSVPDYIYLFNPNTFEYTKLETFNINYSAGPRHGHSAIFCNDTVIILFGVDDKSIVTNDVYFLQMNDGAATWLNQFRLSVSESRDSLLATKEAIGIALGSVSGGLLIIFGICYFIYKKRTNKTKEGKKDDSFDDGQEEPVYVVREAFHDPPPPPSLLSVYKPNQIVSDYSKSFPILERPTTIKPSL